MAYCKKFIILLLILLILFFNLSKCFAVEDIPENYNLIPQNILFNNVNINGSGEVLSANNSNVYYIDISNFDSVLYFNTKGLRYILVDSLDFVVGDTISSTIYNVNSNTSGIYLDTSNISEKYILLSYYIDNTVTVYGKDYSEFNNSVTSLVDSVGPSALWGVFGNGIDFVFVVVIVAFGIFIIYKLVSGFSKGKSKV